MSCNRNTIPQNQIRGSFQDVYNPDSYRTQYDIEMNKKFCCNNNVKESYEAGKTCKKCKYPLKGPSKCMKYCPDCTENSCFRPSGVPDRRHVLKLPYRTLAFDDTDNPLSYNIRYHSLS
tara:strand:- start:134 stop:490 length:357 start_codon:yes stop_codon:yes gene_type:complete